MRALARRQKDQEGAHTRASSPAHVDSEGTDTVRKVISDEKGGNLSLCAGSTRRHAQLALGTARAVDILLVAGQLVEVDYMVVILQLDQRPDRDALMCHCQERVPLQTQLM